MKRILTFIFLFCLVSEGLIAQKKKATSAAAQAATIKLSMQQSLDKKYDEYAQHALQIWGFAEVGYKEEKSAALHIDALTKAGFAIQKGVAGIPTAFVATYGEGQPVIGILAEYDALPGISQTNAPEKQSAGKDAGHACGHHLFGTASAAAAIAVKEQMAAGKLRGTIKLYGCPAEEGGSGKVYMVRAGLFNEVDAVLHWHPDDENMVTMTSALANKSAKFRFHGVSAHAAGSPEKGRSALDGVEAMNMMVNMMREHVAADARIHYVITRGGKAPNVVPDYAEVYYYVRHPKKEEVMAIFDRVTKAAEGAALGTGTSVDFEIIGGTHDLLLNKSLATIMQLNLEQVGGVNYTANELEYAKKIQSSFTYTVPDLAQAKQIKPLRTTITAGGGSTDVGDVSYVVPTVGMGAATWVPGTPAHSWQAVSCGGTSIGSKGMIVAAKTLAATAVDLLLQPATLEQAKMEHIQSVGSYQYKALLGDRTPALNYRDSQ